MSDDDAVRAFSVFTNPKDTQSTVIVGAGIIGCATAYYLATSGNTKPDTIHLVEGSPELFQSASGKSAGFLAPDWFGPATAELGALSFELHKKLAEEFDGHNDWGYSKSTGTSLSEDGRLDGPRGDDWLRTGGSRAQVAGVHKFSGDDGGPAWLARKNGDALETISEDGGVAQVDPLRLCRFLIRQCLKKGVRLHQPARAVKVSRDESNELSAVRVRYSTGAEHKIPCTRLLIAAGAWTPQVFEQLFPTSRLDIPVSSLAGHSLVVKSPRWTREHEASGCHAVFSTGQDGFSPEIFSRVGEEIYLAGLNSMSTPLPESPEQAMVDPESMAKLRRVAERLLGKDGTDVSDLQMVQEGHCFRPITNKGVPILAKVEDANLGGVETKYGSNGVFIAAGHGPWGISQSLGTGKVMQEMMEEVPLSANVDLLGI